MLRAFHARWLAALLVLVIGCGDRAVFGVPDDARADLPIADAPSDGSTNQNDASGDVTGGDGSATDGSATQGSATDVPDVSCPSGTTRCGAVCVDGSNDAFNCGGCGTFFSTGVCTASVCTVPRNCDELHTSLPTASSGRYVIDPDGPGGAASFSVYCDMSTDGGGWTVIHNAEPTVNTGGAGLVAYTNNDATLRAISTRLLVAYRDASNAIAPQWARMGMIPSWRAASPFGALASDESVSISIEGAAPRLSLMRYGLRGWSAVGGACTVGWDTGFNRGRIYFTDTAAPYYAGWTIGDGNYCSASNGAYNASRCAADRRFTIAVR